MYIEDWEAFTQQAEALYRSNPLKTRYVLKYRHCDGKLVLKVTDDVVCLKYFTDQQNDVKKVEKLSQLFFMLMTLGEDAPDVEMTDAAPQHQNSTAPRAAASQKPRRRG